MNEIKSIDDGVDSSALKIDLTIKSSWINKFLEKQKVVIPINDQYSLHHLKIDLGEGKMSVEADIKEKANSSIKLDCSPIWNSHEQVFFIEDFALKTDSNNLLIKSAGWFANTFMGTKLDKKMEEALNQLFALKKEELIKNGIAIPLPDGKGSADIKSIAIEDMKFKTNGIAIKAIIDGKLFLELGEGDLFA